MGKSNIVIDSEKNISLVTPGKVIDMTGAVCLDILLQVRDRNGKITCERQEYGQSFLANFIKILYCSMMMHHAPSVDGSELTLFDTGGTERAGNSYASAIKSSDIFNCDAGIGDAEFGILVGTDDESILPKAINNYALGAKIAHGTGSGQLQYSDHSIVGSTHDGTTYSYAGITRTFSNGSGASIGINEIGLVCNMDWESYVNRYFLFIRDILASQVDVPDGETLTVSYRLKAFC